MSWLTPKRRRTTGNPRALPGGQVNADALPNPTTSERPPKVLRELRQSKSSSSIAGDGNLFYACTRSSSESKHPFLLTFASASIANEWWLLLQTHYPSTTRPSPQLFSFQDENLLPAASKHPAFAHLKTKWMYKLSSDISGDSLGGAALGVIPVQDVEGNMLGGAASPESVAQVGKPTTRRLEEGFEKMMDAVGKNAVQVTLVADKQRDSISKAVRTADESGGDSISAAGLTEQLGRLSELLAKNSEHVEAMSKRQDKNDERLRATLEGMALKQKSDLDLSRLSSHLDRVQGMMENMVTDRQSHLQVDMSLPADRLEKVQEAVEQNSALVKALLDEGTAAGARMATPLWGSDNAIVPHIDFVPLNEHLQRIHAAIGQQNTHLETLVGFAGSESEVKSDRGLAPLGEHLEQIYNAIDEGNKLARPAPVFDLGPLTVHVEALRTNEDHIRRIADSGESIKATLDEVNEHLQSLREWAEYDAEQFNGLLEAQQQQQQEDIAPSSSSFDISPLTEQLTAIHTTMQQQHSSLLEEHRQRSHRDLNPLTARSVEDPQMDSPNAGGLGASTFIISALTSHLSKIQAVTEQNALHIRYLREEYSASQDKMHITVAQTTDQISALTGLFEQQQKHVNQQNGDSESRGGPGKRLDEVRELMAGQRDMVEVLRALAQGVGGKCGHVVVPPPRKMGRRVLGFVYEDEQG